MSETPTPAASEDSGEDTAVDAEGAAGAASAKGGGRRKTLMILIAALLLIGGGGGGAAWWFLGSSSAASDEQVAELPEAFVDVPPIQVSLRSTDGARRMLRLHVMLVPGSSSVEEITARLPLLIDRFQPFLRELRPEDLAGSAGTFRIKEELLIRANQALGQGSVRDILIQDLMPS